mgnify:CR=1 FL=1
MSGRFNKEQYRVLVIGGSAGSFPSVSRILEQLPENYRLPVVMCLHRLRDKREGFKEALEIKSRMPVSEPNDKDPIESAHVYIAPANYHLLVEKPRMFGLAITELVQYSRPSIDVLFESAADVLKGHVLAVLLSGANRDGGLGMKRIHDKGGYTVVQDPATCSMNTMPQAALDLTPVDRVLDLDKIIEFLVDLH